MRSEMRSGQDGTDHDGKYTVQILVRAVHVLDALASRLSGWSLDELGDTLGINKASLVRILRTLEDERLVRRDRDTYTLGPRVLDLSHGYLRGLELTDVARPFMERLAERTGQTVSLAIRDGLEIVYVAIERAQQDIGIQGEIGARHPANATALGKVLLADLAPDALKSELAGQELVRLTHRTISAPDALVRHLEGVRRDGYAIDDEERGIGIRCVAAPVRRADGRVIAGVSVAGPIFHMTEDVMPTHRRALLDATAAISARFGYTPEALPV
jgi:DNA-binding IclR family transcriptional regulator